MSSFVSITFLKDLQTWEGLYIEGTTHFCPAGTARRWAAEGIVSVDSESSELPGGREISALAPIPNKPAATRKGSHKTRII